MKRFQKLIALLLVAVITLTVSACGKDTESNTTTTTEKIISVNAENTTTTLPEESTLVSEESSENTTETEDPSQAPETQAPTPAPETTEPTPAPQPSGVKTITYEANGDVEKQIVYYPAELETGNKTYPIVSWANGTMCTPDLYKDLLREIADGGYIVIASYETMTADGTSQIASIDLMIEENGNSSSIFYKKVDTGKIALIGHSQGGRSSVNASSDPRIDCLISIAGSNYDYEAEQNKVPSLFFSGSMDMIVNKDQWVVPAYELAKGPAVYACLDGAIHTTCCSEPGKYSGYIISWLDAWLYNDSSAKAIFKNGGALSKDSAWTGFATKGF